LILQPASDNPEIMWHVIANRFPTLDLSALC